MTLDELRAKVPAQWQPVVDQYGPAFIAMTSAEIWAWIELALKGDAYATYKAVLEKLPASDLAAEWENLNAAWKEANTANAASMEWQRSAMAAILKVLVTIAASMVVL